MKKIIYKIKYLVVFISTFLMGIFVNAQGLDPNTVTGMKSPTEQLGRSAGFDVANISTSSIGGIMAKVISAFLTLLAIIFIVLIILAGYNWMTAGGEEQKVTKAKDTIQKAVIGLIIIMSAYAITAFVFRNLPDGGGAGFGGVPL